MATKYGVSEGFGVVVPEDTEVAELLMRTINQTGDPQADDAYHAAAAEKHPEVYRTVNPDRNPPFDGVFDKHF